MKRLLWRITTFAICAMLIVDSAAVAASAEGNALNVTYDYHADVYPNYVTAAVDISGCIASNSELLSALGLNDTSDIGEVWTACMNGEFSCQWSCLLPEFANKWKAEFLTAWFDEPVGKDTLETLLQGKSIFQCTLTKDKAEVGSITCRLDQTYNYPIDTGFPIFRKYVYYTSGNDVTLALDPVPATADKSELVYRWYEGTAGYNGDYFDESHLIQGENGPTLTVAAAADGAQYSAMVAKKSEQDDPSAWVPYRTIFSLVAQDAGHIRLPSPSSDEVNHSYMLMPGESATLQVKPVVDYNKDKNLVYTWRYNYYDKNWEWQDPVIEQASSSTLLTVRYPDSSDDDFINNYDYAYRSYFCSAEYTDGTESVDCGYTFDVFFVRVVVDELEEVPETLKDKASSVGALKETMADDLENHLGAKDEKSSQELYDVGLEIYNSDSGEMEKLPAEIFPKNGVDVVVPYPAGTDSSYHFTASHMFAEDSNAFKAGQIEYPTVENTAAGLKIHINGTSPVLFRWTKGAAPTQTQPEKATPPRTSDSVPLWSLLALAGLSIAVVIVAVRLRKRRA